MKIKLPKVKIKEVTWSGWNGGSQEEKIHEVYLNPKRKEIILSRETTSYEIKGIFKKREVEVKKEEIIFALTLIKINPDEKGSIILKVEGLAGDKPTKGMYGKNSKWKPQVVKLNLGETMGFRSPTKDFGWRFEVTLESV